jgi:hypothetical protein
LLGGYYTRNRVGCQVKSRRGSPRPKDGAR